MQRDIYPLMMSAVVATSILGLAISYQNVYLFHGVLVVVLLRSLLVRSRGSLADPRRLPSQYHYGFFATILWFALSLIWSWDRAQAVLYLGYLSIGSALAWLVIKYVHADLPRFQQLGRICLWLAGADILFGLLEVFTPFRLPISPYSPYSKHLASLDQFSSETMLWLTSMPTGFHWNPNNYNAVIAMALPFSLLHRRLWIAVVGLALTVMLSVYGGSRGVLLAIAFMVILAPVYKANARWAVIGCVLAIAGYTLVVAGAFSNYEKIEHAALRSAFSTVEATRNYLGGDETDRSSVGARRHLIENALRALGETYGLGVGGGGDRAVQEEYYELDTEKVFVNTHHFWVELLVNGGVLFFIALTIWYGRLALELYRYGRSFPANSSLAYYCGATSLSLVGFIPAAISASSAIYLLPMYLLLGMAISLVNICREHFAAMHAATLPGRTERHPMPVAGPRQSGRLPTPRGRHAHCDTR